MAGAPNDVLVSRNIEISYITRYMCIILVGYKNNIHIPSISIAIWPKWTRFDRGH